MIRENRNEKDDQTWLREDMDKTMDSKRDSPASSAITAASITSGTTAGNTDSTTTTTTNRDQYLRHLNKLSHKISKPETTVTPLRRPPSGPPLHHRPPPPPPPQQPPVYNINKSDFRDVVQRLTGSPNPATPTATASSRLHRIRPPPLSHLSNHRPPPFLNCASANPTNPRPPLSPLPPLPTCHASAESPISAYMRFLHRSVSAFVPDPMNPPLLSPNLLFSPTGPAPLGFPQLPISPTVPGVPSPK